MKYVRMYADANGESHLEDIEPVTADVQATFDPALTLPVNLLRFVTTESSYDRGWHNAPWRQWVVTLRGNWAIETSDGDIRRFGPGDVLLAEDLTGKGHINHVGEPLERLMIHAGEA
jgi:hypothetical protein